MKNELRGAVLTKFTTISAFAKAMKWDRKKASRIVNRLQRPSATDIEKMAAMLEVKNEDSFVSIFFPTLSTLWDN